jgi:hypothetical protein
VEIKKKKIYNLDEKKKIELYVHLHQFSIYMFFFVLLNLKKNKKAYVNSSTIIKCELWFSEITKYIGIDITIINGRRWKNNDYFWMNKNKMWKKTSQASFIY